MNLSDAILYYSDVTWAPRRVWSPETRPFVQNFVAVKITENTMVALLDFCERNPSMTDGFSSQSASYAEVT